MISTNEHQDIPRPPSVLATPAIEAVWRAAVEQLGFAVVRTNDAYATSDGSGVIAIGVDEALDGDDAFAQLVFHELCHAITQGEGAMTKPDWGLDNVPEHVVREHACLRLQAELATPFGLRGAMAPTTPYRAYYDTLPASPLAADADPAIAIAAEAASRFATSSWRAPIEAALAATAALTRRATHSGSRSGRQARRAAAARGSTSAGADRRCRAAGRRRRPLATVRGRCVRRRRARAGRRQSTVRAAAPAAARRITR